MFTILNNYDKIFIEITSNDIININIPFLTYKDKYYIEAREYFKEYYGLEVTYCHIDESDDVHLHIYVKGRIFVDILTIFPTTSTIEAIELEPHVERIKISMPVHI